MELIQLGEKTYYIKNPTNIGIYRIDDERVYLIDSGNDKDAGKKILKIVEEQGWTVAGIISTHSNADHIGGNKVIQDRTGAVVMAHGIEKCITENPLIEPAFLYGSNPFKELKNKFLMAKESNAVKIEGNLPEGLELISLKGHFFDMIGIKTSDNVYFVADSLFSEETITKYHLFFIYDIKAYLETLDYLEDLNGDIYVPSHCEASKDITKLVELNRSKIHEVIECIYDLCNEPKTFEAILKCVFDKYELLMNISQYVLIGSTVKSYLSYLKEENRITYDFVDNQMLWRQV